MTAMNAATGKTLVEILTAETQELKNEYLAKTEEWAKRRFIHSANFVADFYTVHYVDVKPYTAKWNQLQEDYHRAKQVTGRPFPEYLKRELKYANEHYENSIKKLAARIEKKGLNQSALAIKTARVGVNIETTLTDGIKTVRAWTIIASGEIQRPHYRYLVK